MTLSRRDSQIVHARQRFWERLHIKLTNRLCQQIVRQIILWKGAFDGWCGTNRQVWFVRIPDIPKPVRVVYDIETKQLVTVLAERDSKGRVHDLEVTSEDNPQSRNWRGQLSKIKVGDAQCR